MEKIPREYHAERDRHVLPPHTCKRRAGESRPHCLSRFVFREAGNLRLTGRRCATPYFWLSTRRLFHVENQFVATSLEQLFFVSGPDLYRPDQPGALVLSPIDLPSSDSVLFSCFFSRVPPSLPSVMSAVMYH